VKYKKLSLVILLLLIVPQLVDALHYGNDLIPPFPEGSRIIIESHVIDGATNFFKAKAAAMLLFADSEAGAKESFEYSSAILHADNAIEFLEKARSSYLLAYNFGKSAGYIKTRQDVLRNFDFETFQNDRKLNSSIMSKVKPFLSNGDVTGFYNQLITDISEIIELMTAIRGELSKNIKPDNSLYWELLQKISEATLFGNYGTMVGIHAFGG
jgi:hypothetical protein